MHEKDIWEQATHCLALITNCQLKCKYMAIQTQKDKEGMSQRLGQIKWEVKERRKEVLRYAELQQVPHREAGRPKEAKEGKGKI